MLFALAKVLFIPLLSCRFALHSKSTARWSSRNELQTGSIDASQALPLEIPDTMMKHFVNNNNSTLTAAAALEKVLKIPQEHVFAAVCQNAGKLKNLESWAKISRGSDLFLKGMGKFDIEGEYRSWKETEGRVQGGLPFMHMLQVGFKREYFRKYKLKKPGSSYTDEDDCRLLRCPDFNPTEAVLDAIRNGKLRAYIATPELMKRIIFSGPDWWFVDVVSFQVHIYFGKFNLNQATKKYLRNILSTDEECPARIHLQKYYHGWCKPQNLASLDELSRVATAMRKRVQCFWPDGWERMRPEELLRIMREAVNREMDPKLRVESPFHHLDLLPDKDRIRVLRSASDLVNTGRSMKNCAASYSERVRDQRALLIVLDKEDKPGTPYALGLKRFDKSSMERNWGQIYLSCNRAAPPEVQQKFYDFEETLQRWYRAQYLDSEDSPSSPSPDQAE